MIDAAKLTVSDLPAATEAGNLLSGDGAELNLQATDLEEVNFGNALLSQLDELTESTVLESSNSELTEQVILPDGKELPSLSVTGVATELELSVLAGTESDLPLENNSDVIIAGQALILPLQLEPERVEKISPDTIQSRRKLPLTAIAGTDADNQVDMLVSTKNDDTAVKRDSTANNFILPLAEVKTLEQSAEPPAIAGAGDSSKATSAESLKQSAGVLKLSIEAPVQQAKWGENLAGRVAWMVMNNQQSAQISLNPAELGPIEVKVSLQNDQASVSFYAQNNSVRDAIEEAFPRLRDMLNENGVNLSQSSVSDQSLSQRQGYSETAEQEQSRYPFMEGGVPVDASTGESISMKLGLVDHYV